MPSPSSLSWSLIDLFDILSSPLSSRELWLRLKLGSTFVAWSSWTRLRPRNDCSVKTRLKFARRLRGELQLASLSGWQQSCSHSQRLAARSAPSSKTNRCESLMSSSRWMASRRDLCENQYTACQTCILPGTPLAAHGEFLPWWTYDVRAKTSDYSPCVLFLSVGND